MPFVYCGQDDRRVRCSCVFAFVHDRHRRPLLYFRFSAHTNLRTMIYNPPRFHPPWPAISPTPYPRHHSSIHAKNGNNKTGLPPKFAQDEVHQRLSSWFCKQFRPSRYPQPAPNRRMHRLHRCVLRLPHQHLPIYQHEDEGVPLQSLHYSFRPSSCHQHRVEQILQTRLRRLRSWKVACTEGL